MECTRSNGVFFYTKKLDSEWIVRCLQAMLNNLPDVKLTAIIADESFLGYRVYFSSPEEEVVLSKLQLMVYGQNIQTCPLKTCLRVHDIGPREEDLSESDIREDVEKIFSKLINTASVPESPIHQNGNNQSLVVFTQMPEIMAIKKFERERSNAMILPIPDKKLKLKVTLCCRHCRKDSHLSQDCKTGHADLQVPPMEASNNESALADSTMNIESKIGKFSENLGMEEIIKEGYLSEDNQMVEEKYNPDTKEVKKEPESSRPGTSGENLDSVSPHKEDSHSNAISDDDVQVLPCEANLSSENSWSCFRIKTENKTGADNFDEDSNAGPPEDPGPTSKRRRAAQPPIAVEDMGVLSPSLQECIDKSLGEFGILSREKLQAFFHHCKKKSNVVEVAVKYTPDPSKLKQVLQLVCRLYYSTTQTGTKEDKRFIKWLGERIEKFDKKMPQKRRRGFDS